MGMAGRWRVRVVGVVATAVMAWAAVAVAGGPRRRSRSPAGSAMRPRTPSTRCRWRRWLSWASFAGTECAQGFCPDDAIDRKTMAVWMVRVLDREDPPAASESRFDDVDAHSFQAPFIERLAELGVTGGCGDGTGFCPMAW